MPHTSLQSGQAAANFKAGAKQGLRSRIKQRIRKRYDVWIRNRAKPTQETTLSQRRIYIFLSREGILYAVLLLITFIAGVNYANNLVLGLCFYLGSVLVICIHYTYAQLSGLHIKLLEVANAEAGGKVLVRIQVAATGSKPHRQIRMAFYEDKHADVPKNSEYISPKYTAQTLPSVLEPQIVTFYLPAGKRGKFTLPRLTLSSVYPLGILRTWSYVHFSPTSWVWPKPLAFTQYGQDFTAASSEATVTGQKKGQDDFDKLDTYQQGESMARVSWRHVASGRGILTKHFADPVGQDVLLDYANMPASTHEAKLSQLSFAVQQLSQSYTPYALSLPSGQLALNAGSEHEKQALLLLAQAPILAAKSAAQPASHLPAQPEKEPASTSSKQGGAV